MKPFPSDDFLLSTPTARALYYGHAAQMPIMDYHCHIDPRAIWEDARYENITQVWLGGDHYKWRLMRWAGVDERFITGDAPDREKFRKWAEVLGRSVGNPLYHWSHLELQRYFGYKGILNGATADAVWTLCNDKLRQPEFSVRNLILHSNVRLICTTDDPADSLEWHRKLADDRSFHVTVLPAWRPDKALAVDSPAFASYMQTLADVSGAPISDFDGWKNALSARMDVFHGLGCRLSDHALIYVMYAPTDDAGADAILKRALRGEIIDPGDAERFRTVALSYLAGEYARRGWAMQLHFGCLRNNNRAMFERLGPDTGFDSIANGAPADRLMAFLDALNARGALPRTILYSLDPNDDLMLDVACGCFQSDGIVGKVQHGSAWWFNDHLGGMEKQLRSLASVGYLPGFIGMLTDSRSFLSYPRHEYFRRILCRVLGEWVEDELFPNDDGTLGQIVEDISYNNANAYFAFPEKR